MNLRKFRKATAKKRLLDNHKEKKKRKRSDNNSIAEDPEHEYDDHEIEDQIEEPIDTTSESNTMTLEQFTDIVLASEGMFSSYCK